MAKTLALFLTYVKADFKRDDKDTEITQAYNDTIRHLSSLKGLEGRKFTSYIATSIGREDYALPEGTIHIFHPVRFVEGVSLENGYSMNKMSREEWTALYINPNNSTVASITKGMPKDYCVYQKALHVGPIPDKATYIIEIDWAKIATAQAADSDIQELGENWEEVIKWGTLFRLYAGMGLDDEAKKWFDLYRDNDLGYPYLLRQEGGQTEKMGTVEFRDI